MQATKYKLTCLGDLASDRVVATVRSLPLPSLISRMVDIDNRHTALCYLLLASSFSFSFRDFTFVFRFRQAAVAVAEFAGWVWTLFCVLCFVFCVLGFVFLFCFCFVFVFVFCFWWDWDVHVAWACYACICPKPPKRVICPKPPIWPLIAFPDLTNDPSRMSHIAYQYHNTNKHKFCTNTRR